MSSSFLQSTGSAAGGAGFNILFDTFLKAILTVSKKNSIFEPTFRRLEKTLQAMAPAIKKIDVYNRDFDRPEEIDGLKAILTKGADLVTKCSKIRRYDIIRKPMYASKLLKLEDKLKRYNTTVLQVHQVADQKEILFEVKQLGNQVRQMSMGGAAYGFGTVGGGFSPPMLKMVPVGLEIPLKELKKKVMTDALPFLVLSAPGGCGKTTLATAFCHDPQVKVRFKDNIIFITVSKAANLLTIGQNIFQRLGRRVPCFQSEEDAVNQLECLLKDMNGEPTLLVLDDVWSGAQSLLESLKFEFIKNYQLLVTSRDEFKAFGSTYKLQTLSDADAMNLFRQSAFPQDGRSYERDAEVQEKVIFHIVKSCKGFPLLISVVGKSLLGKPAADWRNRAKECSKTASFLENVEVLNCLKKSVDALDDKQAIKECYMDLGLFPEDTKMPATALLDIWVELHGLEDDYAISNLYELSFRNLVDLVVIRKDTSEDDGFHNEDFVTQHDLLRDLAILQSNSSSIEHRERLFIEITGNKFPDWWMESRNKVFKSKLLSITTDENFSASWPEIHAPEVEVLVLNFKSQNYAFPKFIEKMVKLKVLIVTNHGMCPADLSDFHHLSFLSNLKRIRLEKISIPPDFLPAIALRKLEKLALFMCNIGEAFSNIDLEANSFPNLDVIDVDYCSDLMALPVWLFELVQLRKLSISNCQNLSELPEELGNLGNLEVLRLSSCIELSELPETVGNLGKLKTLDISDCASIKKLPEQISELCNLRKLYMIECDRCELPVSVTELSNLKEVIGDEETANSWEVYKPYLPDLKIIKHKQVSLDWLH
ncbi:Probable disease resistance protein At5g66900 [Linum grandiflorum]